MVEWAIGPKMSARDETATQASNVEKFATCELQMTACLLRGSLCIDFIGIFMPQREWHGVC